MNEKDAGRSQPNPISDPFLSNGSPGDRKHVES